jgi:hypothetical protein
LHKIVAPYSSQYKPMNIVRGVFGVLLGGVLWMMAFLVLARLLMLAWPEYGVHAHTWMSAQIYDFTALMSGFNIVFWILSEVGAGWLAVVIAGRRQAGWVLAALVMAYMCFMHLYYVWNSLPWWYNLLVAIPSGPAVLLGSKLAESFVRGSRGTTTVAA